MKSLTLRQLRYFDALAQHRHFGRAAEASAISQPALSMQIRELEDLLGAALIERSGRQLRLTAFGETFAREARDILDRIEDLGDLARAARQEFSGRLRIGVIPTAAPYLLPAFVTRLNALFPGLELMLRETITPKLIEELLAGRLDTAIVALPVSEPGLTEVPLFSENFVLVRQASEADQPVPPPDSLREMRLLLLEEGHCFRDQALAFCGRPSERMRETLDGSTLSTLVQMVGAGIGVTLIPEMAVAVETRSAAVSVARFADPQPSRVIGMVWRRNNPLTKQLKRIAEEVASAAGQIRAD